MSKEYKSYDGILIEPYNFSDKKTSVNNYIKYMLARTQSMFKYDNLPDTIPQRMLELYLQSKGNCVITNVNGELYALVGGLGGEPDAYYRPTLYTVANPFLKFNKVLKINEDCVLIYNDSLMTGLMPMFSRYATQLVENDISMNIADINSRIISLISATDDRTRISAQQYLKDVTDGKLGIIADNSLINEDSIKAQVFGNSSSSETIKNLIEYHRYIKASWFNDLGLNANYNMKREAINSSESALNDDALLPLIDDMLKCRKDAVDKINKMFGTNITVSLNSSWEDNVKELELEQENMKVESKTVTEDKTEDTTVNKEESEDKEDEQNSTE